MDRDHLIKQLLHKALYEDSLLINAMNITKAT
jgi:hypothetical protein